MNNLTRLLSFGLLLAITVFVVPTLILADETEFRAYPIKHKSARDLEPVIKKMIGDFPETEIVIDAKGNKILLSGTEDVHKIVGQLVQTLDRPPRKRSGQRASLKAFAVDPQKFAETSEGIRRAYSGRDDVRIVADADSSQLLIFAMPSVHDEISRKLSPNAGFSQTNKSRGADQLEFDESGNQRLSQPSNSLNKGPGTTNDGQTGQWAAGQPEEPAKLRPRPRRQRRMTPIERFVRIRSTDVDQVESKLLATLGNRIKADTRDDVDYMISAAGQKVELTVYGRRQGFWVSGPETVTVQVAQLIRILDSQPQEPEQRIRIVPIRRSDPTKVQQAIQAYRLGYRSKLQDLKRSKTNDDAQGFRAPDEVEKRKVSQKKSMQVIELVNFQEAADVSSGGDSNETGADDDLGSEGDVVGRSRRRELGPGVEIESLPDLDVIIIRGRDREVDEVTRIIQEIERLSAETTPTVEIYPLQHVAGDAVSELIETINDDYIGGRQGRVVVIALEKPNSLLLIGWGEAVKAIKELIARIDQPVDPTSQLKVFRLKHAASALALNTVTQFFNNRQGLGAEVRVEADQRTNSLIVQASPRDMQEIVLLLKKLDVDRSHAVNQARIFRLKNSLANELAVTLQSAIDTNTGAGNNQRSTALELMTIDAEGKKIIKSGILTDVKITPDPQRNALIVSAPEESMNLIEALIRQMDDQPAAVAQIKVFRILNGDAGSLVQMLRSLLPSQTGADVSPALPGTADEQSLAPLRFSVDERTNSIIATGSAGDLRIIEALLLKLDEEAIKQRKTIVYRLKNAPAMFVSRAVNDFLRSERQVQQTGISSESPFLQIEREVVVVAEQISNSLIISATPRYFEEVREVVEKLDSQPPQVMIQVLIGEVTLNDADELGVELGLQDSLLFDRSLLGDLVTTTNSSQASTPAGILTTTQEVIQAASNSPGFLFNDSPLGSLPNSGSTQAVNTSNSLAGQALSNFATGRLNSELGFGGLVLSASNESVSILLRALRETRRMEVLSRPQVMTLDNQPAFIQIGQRVPRIVASNITETGGQVNTVELENTGILLGVTPRISPDGTIVMDLDVEKSEVGPDAEGIPVSVSPEGTVIRSPRIDVTQAQTTVSAATGQTIILGGLITKGTSEIHRSVPWLSDVPVLGNLFRYDSVVARRTELLIIMTPYIVYGPDDVEQIKQEEAARMHWSLADVHDIHGETGICTAPHCAICNRQIPVVYPDMNPRGMLPVETDQHHHMPAPYIQDGELPLDAYPKMPVPELPPQLGPDQPLPENAIPEQPMSHNSRLQNKGEPQRLTSQNSKGQPSAFKRLTGRWRRPFSPQAKSSNTNEVATTKHRQVVDESPMQNGQPPRRLFDETQQAHPRGARPIQNNMQVAQWRVTRRYSESRDDDSRDSRSNSRVRQASLMEPEVTGRNEQRTRGNTRHSNSDDNGVEVLDFDFSDAEFSDSEF